MEVLTGSLFLLNFFLLYITFYFLFCLYVFQLSQLNQEMINVVKMLKKNLINWEHRTQRTFREMGWPSSSSCHMEEELPRMSGVAWELPFPY